MGYGWLWIKTGIPWLLPPGLVGLQVGHCGSFFHRSTSTSSADRVPPRLSFGANIRGSPTDARAPQWGLSRVQRTPKPSMRTKDHGG